MTDGTSQGLFITVAIVIFGIFVVLAYILFEDTLSPALANMFTEASEQTQKDIFESRYLGKNLLPNGDNMAKSSYHEFIVHEDLAPIFDTFGVGKYTISFDLKVPTDGRVDVYLHNGNSYKYQFYKVITGTTVEKRHSIKVDVANVDKNLSHYDPEFAHLAFYGIYGTGKYPSVKNVKVELGHVDGIPQYEDSPKGLSYK